MSTTNRSARIKTIGATAAITVGLVAGGAGIAAAASSLAPHHDGPEGHEGHGAPRGDAMGHGAGTVTAVSPTSLTVKGLDGTSTTFALNSSTTFEKDRDVAATAADVTVGSHVLVVPSSSSATTAAHVHLVLPHLAGTVEKVDGAVVTISDEQGFWHTIDTSASTTYLRTGSTSSASASDVTTGSFVMATGTIAADHTSLEASSVSIGLPTPPAKGTAPHAKGATPPAKDRGRHDDD
jgi:hypothetical protein